MVVVVTVVCPKIVAGTKFYPVPILPGCEYAVCMHHQQQKHHRHGHTTVTQEFTGAGAFQKWTIKLGDALADPNKRDAFKLYNAFTAAPKTQLMIEGVSGVQPTEASARIAAGKRVYQGGNMNAPEGMYDERKG